MTNKMNLLMMRENSLDDQQRCFVGLVRSSLMKEYLGDGANLCPDNLLALFSLAQIALRNCPHSSPPLSLKEFSLPENRGLSLTQLRLKHPHENPTSQSNQHPGKQLVTE
jgi:hypothetical protein